MLNKSILSKKKPQISVSLHAKEYRCIKRLFILVMFCGDKFYVLFYYSGHKSLFI